MALIICKIVEEILKARIAIRDLTIIDSEESGPCQVSFKLSSTIIAISYGSCSRKSLFVKTIGNFQNSQEIAYMKYDEGTSEIISIKRQLLLFNAIASTG